MHCVVYCCTFASGNNGANHLIKKDMPIQVKKDTDARPECNFCFDNKSEILQIIGSGFIRISVCRECLAKMVKLANEERDYNKPNS